MLEEYLCLGGTEIANNARTYGYATTSGCPMSWFRCEPCETLREATGEWIPPTYRTVELGRNLATNPSFETTSGTVEVRRNSAVNPSFETDVTNSSYVNAGTGATIVRSTAQAHTGAASALFTYGTGVSTLDSGISLGNNLTLAVGETVTASAYVYQAALVGGGLRMAVFGAATNPAGTQRGVHTTVVGAWSRVSVTFTATTAGVFSAFIGTGVSNAVAGSTFYVDSVLIEKSPVMGPYFDGGTQFVPDADLTAAWTGTANNSASTLTGLGVPGAVTANPLNRVVISSTAWANSGARSIRIIPNSTAAEPGGARVWTFTTGDVGKSYTALATIRLAAPLTGTLHANSRRIALVDGSGYPAASAAAPNGAGVTDLRLFFTVTASGQTVNLIGGSSAGNGDVWWDNLLLVEGEYNGSYFDGDTAEPTTVDDIFWTGTPNASESVWEQEQVDAPGRTLNPEYTIGNITDAPWYDADVPASTRFYGVYVISIENLNSSTRTASVTEGILDGGVVGLVRNATREVRTRALLVAEGNDALEYGIAWLSAALATEDCSTHGSTCGAADLSFFAYCPEAPDPVAPPDSNGSDTWDMDLYAPRFLHGVTVTSGPLVEQYLKSSNGRHVGYIVEWTMVAATPWVFGTTNEINVSPSAPVIVQDLPFNLMPYPSAELSAGTVVVQTNYSTNPSVETNATGWVPSSVTITPTPTGARSTEVAADGVASYKVSVTATNSGTAGSIRAYQDVTLPAESAGERFSVTMWGFMALVSGTAVLGSLRLTLQWQDAGGTTLSTVDGGSGPVSGGAISTVGLTRPTGAVRARVWMVGDVTSWSTGAVLNLFADALALTSP